MQETHDQQHGKEEEGNFGHLTALLPSLTVRVVSSTDRKVTVSPIVREHFFDQHANTRGCDGLPREGGLAADGADDDMDVDKTSYPERYVAESGYRSKCILLFQRIDGADVALFALYTQEYDLTCPAPNTGRVYIAYLDSVKHFCSHTDSDGYISSCPGKAALHKSKARVMPHGLRSAIYHEILLGYLAHASARGFENAHIWACPPQRSLSYIFWCHPPDQRTPSREHLRDWYAKLLERGKLLGITAQPDGLYETFFLFGMSAANDDSASAGAPKVGRAKSAKLVTSKKAKTGLTKVQGKAQSKIGKAQGKMQGKAQLPMEVEVQGGNNADATLANSPSGSTSPRASSIAAASTITSAFATAAAFGGGGKPGMEMLRRMHDNTQQKLEQDRMIAERQKQRELRVQQQAEREAKAKELKAKQLKQKQSSRSASRAPVPVHHVVQTISTRRSREREWQDAISGAGDRFEWPRGLPPYFDGDFWPMEAEHAQNAEMRVKQQHENALEHQAAVVAAGQGKPLEVAYSTGASFGEGSTAEDKQQYASSLARSLSKRGPELRQPSWLMKTVSASVMRQKEDHIVVALIPPTAATAAGNGQGNNRRRGQSPRSRRKTNGGDAAMADSSRDTSLTMVQRAATVWSHNEKDTDDDFPGRKYVDTRQAFHQLCSFSRLQFDTLRHAKHSTMMLLQRLHDTSMPLPFHACSECKLIITARRHWHCEPADFHACDACARRHRATGKGHELVFSIPSELDSQKQPRMTPS
jgi:hypothetical protein